jgi:acyl carrier protein
MTATMTKDQVFAGVVKVLTDMTEDWDVDLGSGITAETGLVSDLSFESIDVVHFVTALEEHYQRRDLPFQDVLMEDGKYVEDIHVGDVVDFLVKHLGAK